jgi:hypothetical protein
MPNLTGARRDAYVVERRIAGAGFAEIGAELGISRQRAHQIHNAALARSPERHIERHRQQQAELLTAVNTELLAVARDRSVATGTRVKSYEALIKGSERLSRLLGLDAPTRQEVAVLTVDAITRELTTSAEYWEHQAQIIELPTNQEDTA